MENEEERRGEDRQGARDAMERGDGAFMAEYVFMPGNTTTMVLALEHHRLGGRLRDRRVSGRGAAAGGQKVSVSSRLEVRKKDRSPCRSCGASFVVTVEPEHRPELQSIE